MYAKNDIERLIESAKKYALCIPAEMLAMPAEELCKICNGVGCEHPEHIPSALRKVLNKVMRFAECSAAIHDYEAVRKCGRSDWCIAFTERINDKKKEDTNADSTIVMG